MELLIQYYKIPGHWAYQHSGLNGGNTKKGSQKASEWLCSRFCPTKRSVLAIQNKVYFIFKGCCPVADIQWKDVHARWKETYDWASGTGAGDGGRLISRAEGQDLIDGQAELESEYYYVPRSLFKNVPRSLRC